jgi:hypothetical protein
MVMTAARLKNSRDRYSRGSIRHTDQKPVGQFLVDSHLTPYDLGFGTMLRAEPRGIIASRDASLHRQFGACPGQNDLWDYC